MQHRYIFINNTPIKFPVFKSDTAAMITMELIEAQELDPEKHYTLTCDGKELLPETLILKTTGQLELVERKQHLQTV